MLTHKDFLQMKDYTRIFLTCIFQVGSAFKKKFITPYRGWGLEDYNIHRLHISGHRVRVGLEFYGGDTHSVYLNLNEVYEWLLEQQGKLNNA